MPINFTEINNLIEEKNIFNIINLVDKLFKNHSEVNVNILKEHLNNAKHKEYIFRLLDEKYLLRKKNDFNKSDIIKKDQLKLSRIDLIFEIVKEDNLDKLENLVLQYHKQYQIESETHLNRLFSESSLFLEIKKICLDNNLIRQNVVMTNENVSKEDLLLNIKNKKSILEVRDAVLTFNKLYPITSRLELDNLFYGTQYHDYILELAALYKFYEESDLGSQDTVQNHYIPPQSDKQNSINKINTSRSEYEIKNLLYDFNEKYPLKSIDEVKTLFSKAINYDYIINCIKFYSIDKQFINQNSNHDKLITQIKVSTNKFKVEKLLNQYLSTSESFTEDELNIQFKSAFYASYISALIKEKFEKSKIIIDEQIDLDYSKIDKETLISRINTEEDINILIELLDNYVERFNIKSKQEITDNFSDGVNYEEILNILADLDIEFEEETFIETEVKPNLTSLELYSLISNEKNLNRCIEYLEEYLKKNKDSSHEMIISNFENAYYHKEIQEYLRKINYNTNPEIKEPLFKSNYLKNIYKQITNDKQLTTLTLLKIHFHDEIEFYKLDYWIEQPLFSEYFHPKLQIDIVDSFVTYQSTSKFLIEKIYDSKKLQNIDLSDKRGYGIGMKNLFFDNHFYLDETIENILFELKPLLDLKK
ncbi:hypothetical protein KMW28_12895 [Flammeovirga yaeyamensis]|uniref:Uncharacterized protein n=1 Tax=Flammeovirga yaeyamensis TaxID=367791 RepID=A0AAX1MZ42_9BACT|nr:hypothetical protein [Flammeovirga yaeyamensis]MBB3695933.1 hypothetical protein [Flammeovirga yaeyamensis]NMF34621.1 hypothetical protein [Flammeovirga yaeyamensis]QWG00549.1 hypothetical protein KMW28_12895 [Flammeovirga yaeyamensis]